MRTTAAVFATLLLLSGEIAGQVNDRPVTDSLTAKIVQQFLTWPQEKIHLHTDRQVYLSGETVWFRAWVTDAVIHTPVANQYVTAELINQAGTVVSRVRVRAQNNAYHGNIKLDQMLPGGEYTLTAYSERMQEAGPDYFFRRKIRIEGPWAATVRTETSFIFESDEKITALVEFRDIRSGHKVRPDRVRMYLNNQAPEDVRISPDTTARLTFRLSAGSSPRILNVETTRSSESIPVPYPPGDYEVGFYPEGGYMAEGAASLVAFRTLGSDGNPVEITGRIIDDSGNEYAQMQTYHDGMGSFFLIPARGVTYRAVCTDSHGTEKTFTLPQSRSDVHILSISNSADTLFVSALSSPGRAGYGELFLVMHTRGLIHYAAPWDKAFSTLAYDTRRFPSGVMQVILFDGHMNPLSERLVFIHNNDQATAALRTDRQNYEKRSPVTAAVSVTGPDGAPRTGSFSVSVTDDAAIDPDTSVNILTTLLLTSDIRGQVNNPAFYFLPGNRRSARALDLLMLTNGWRRYDIPEVLKGNLHRPESTPKTGMEITGRVRSLILGKPLENYVVSAFSWAAGYYEETVTDSEGRFAFRNIEFPDSTQFLLQALNQKGNNKVEIVPDREFFPGVTPLPSSPLKAEQQEEEIQQLGDYITRADTRYTMENGMRTVYIDEVVITAKSPETKDYAYSYYMPTSDKDILSGEEIEALQPVFLSDVLRYIPHVEIVADSNGQKKAVVQRMSYALTGSQVHYAALIVDDIIIHDYDLDLFNPMDVERIGVLRGTRAIMLGSDATGGAIVITTKRGRYQDPDTPLSNIAVINPLGYQAPAEFYSPLYETEESRSIGPPDLRTTIHWEPDVSISPEGVATFGFCTADTPASYRVLIEGVTSDGLIIHKTGRILNESPGRGILR